MKLAEGRVRIDVNIIYLEVFSMKSRSMYSVLTFLCALILALPVAMTPPIEPKGSPDFLLCYYFPSLPFCKEKK